MDSGFQRRNNLISPIALIQYPRDNTVYCVYFLPLQALIKIYDLLSVLINCITFVMKYSLKNYIKIHYKNEL